MGQYQFSWGIRRHPLVWRPQPPQEFYHFTCPNISWISNTHCPSVVVAEAVRTSRDGFGHAQWMPASLCSQLFMTNQLRSYWASPSLSSELMVVKDPLHGDLLNSSECTIWVAESKECGHYRKPSTHWEMVQVTPTQSPFDVLPSVLHLLWRVVGSDFC